MVARARTVHAAPSIREYIVAIGQASRQHPDIYLGASPRASIMLLRASRSHAAASGRDFVTPDDVKELAPFVLSHRVICSADAVMNGRSAATLVSEILERVPVPISGRT
jgi:MoxR-like ATPase